MFHRESASFEQNRGTRNRSTSKQFTSKGKSFQKCAKTIKEQQEKKNEP